MGLIDELRSMTPAEMALLEKLLSVDFPGRDELHAQIQSAVVSKIDEDGSLAIAVSPDIAAPVDRRIPVEGEVEDVDGVMIHVLLHVLDGRATELEIFREDPKRVIMPIDADILRVVLF